MLILVGVTVTVALQGGLFKTAREATTNTQEERDKELTLSDGKVEIDGEKYDSIDEYIKGGVVPTVNDYGKYVKYGVDLNGDGNIKNDWKVFYVDDNNNTFIIAADYVTGDKCEELKTAIGEDKAHMTKNTKRGYEYCYYWKGISAAVYHCYDKHNETVKNDHTTKKEQCSFPDLFMATGYYCSDHVGDDGKGGNPNSRCASTLLCSGNWSSFVDESYGATFAIGGPTLEMWVASWNKKHGNSEDTTKPLYCIGTSNNNFGYCVGRSEFPTSSDVAGRDYYGSNDDGYGDTLYFPHKNLDNFDLDGDGQTDETCAGYWFASPSDWQEDGVFCIGCSGRIFGMSYDFDNYGLRPVVCLSSGVKLAENQNS